MRTTSKWFVFAGVALATNALGQGWEAISPMPTARMGVAGVGRNGWIYALGGSTTNSVATVVGANEAYSVENDYWVSLTPMPTPRRFASAAVDNCGRIYVIGGSNPNFTPPMTNIVERYSPDTDTWESLPPMPSHRVHAAITTDLDGRIWVMGGFFNGVQLTAVEVFVPRPCCSSSGELGEWLTTLPPLLVAAGEVGGATGPDGTVYAIGGANTVEGCFSLSGQAIRFVQAFDAGSPSWSYKRNMPTPRGLAGTTTKDGRLVYSIGGRVYPSATAVGVVETYDLETDEWAAAPSLLTARADLGAGTANGIVCAFGGYDAGANILASAECLHRRHHHRGHHGGDVHGNE